MKTSARRELLPFEVEHTLGTLGERISVARRARAWTQADLAAKAGIGLSTMVAIERGAPTVQIGYWLHVLWTLDLLGGFESVAAPETDALAQALMRERLPRRVRGKTDR